MKLLIKYRKALNVNFLPCTAEAEYNGITFIGYGDSYEQAKKEVLKRVEEYKNAEVDLIPEPEEVEI